MTQSQNNHQRFAILVDAGYLVAAGVSEAFGESVSRKFIRFKNPAEVMASLRAHCEQITGMSFLRTYWFDAIFGYGMTDEQDAIARQPMVKFRSGQMTYEGKQKRVDSKIIAELRQLSENRAVDGVVIISGDADIIDGVEEAQARGLLVHVLSVGDLDTSVSREFQRSADAAHSLPAEWAESHLMRIEEPAGQGDHLGGTRSNFRIIQAGENALEFEDAVAEAFLELTGDLDEAGREDLARQIGATDMIPREYDRRMLPIVSRLMGRDLVHHEIKTLRQEFRSRVSVWMMPPVPAAAPQAQSLH